MKIEKNPRTDVDVQLLWSVFPSILPDGQEITHAQIEAVLGESRLTSRYRRTVKRWRRELFIRSSVFLDGELARGRGFVSLSANEMVSFAHRGVRRAGRQVVKAFAVATLPADADLSDTVRNNRARLVMAIEHVHREHRDTFKAISKAFAPKKQLPRASGA